MQESTETSKNKAEQMTPYNKMCDIYQEYKNIMFHIAAKYLHNSDDVQEVVQDTFVEIANCIDKFQDVKSNSTRCLVCLMVKWNAFDILKRNGRVIPMDEPPSNNSFIDIDDYIAEKIAMHNVIASLSHKEKEFIFLRYNMGYSIAQIAADCYSNVNTIKQTIRRTKAKMKVFLNEEGVYIGARKPLHQKDEGTGSISTK